MIKSLKIVETHGKREEEHPEKHGWNMWKSIWERWGSEFGEVDYRAEVNGQQ